MGEQLLQIQSDLEAFSLCVEKIYDTALDPQTWPVALEHIVHLVGADMAGIHFGDMSTEDVAISQSHIHGASERLSKKLLENASTWALQSGLPFWDVGDVRHLPDILPREEFLQGRFYKEVLHPEKQDDYIGMLAVKDGTRLVPFTLGTTIGSPTFQPASIEIMRLLSSHICKSAKIGFALELKTIETESLEATLDNMSCGIYLVHRDGRITFMNRAAEQQVNRRVGLCVVNNRIKPNNPDAEALLLRAMASDTETNITPVSIALKDENGGLLATVLRLDKGLRQNFTNRNPAIFAIFVQSPEVSPPIPGAAFAKLYGLTPAEMRVTLAMAPGLGPQGAADILGLSVATVKTHLQHIFTKTNTNKQAHLMQLLARATTQFI
jgi:DNA-binding CsgD family transcriptional regulator/PAS domain-containing protein